MNHAVRGRLLYPPGSRNTSSFKPGPEVRDKQRGGADLAPPHLFPCRTPGRTPHGHACAPNRPKSVMILTPSRPAHRPGSGPSGNIFAAPHFPVSPVAVGVKDPRPSGKIFAAPHFPASPVDVGVKGSRPSGKILAALCTFRNRALFVTAVCKKRNRILPGTLSPSILWRTYRILRNGTLIAMRTVGYARPVRKNTKIRNGKRGKKWLERFPTVYPRQQRTNR